MKKNSNGPLTGIRVIELGTAVTAPMCGRLLGEMGADVIKVERPGTGDDSRRWGTMVNGESLYFAWYNGSKRSCAVDLKDPQGLEIFRDLVRRSDVLLDNMKPGALAGLGLSEPRLGKLNPRLIHCSISGFGKTKSLQGFPAYDIIIQAMSGLMSVTGEPEGEPMRVGVPIVDIVTSLICGFSIALALYNRDGTKKGEVIEVSLLGAALQAVGQWVVASSVTGRAPQRFGNRYPLITPYEPYRTKDGWLMIAVGNESQWRKLCTALGLTQMLHDDRFVNNQVRIREENRAALARSLEATLRRRSSEEWAGILMKAGVPASPVRTLDQVVADHGLFDSRMLTWSEHPAIGRIAVPGLIAEFGSSPGRIRGPAPLLGQHTADVLRSMGRSRSEIALLKKNGVIGIPEKG